MGKGEVEIKNTGLATLHSKVILKVLQIDMQIDMQVLIGIITPLLTFYIV